MLIKRKAITERLNFQIDKPLKRKLVEVCEEEQVSQAEYIRTAIVEKMIRDGRLKDDEA